MIEYDDFRRFNLGEGQKIIDKELASPKGPDDFGGEDYPHSFGKEDFPPIVSEEDANVIKKFYNDNPSIKKYPYTNEEYTFNSEDVWIQTYTGKRFYPLSPKAESITIEDIAKSLSQQCRFTGHCRFHYSVAQHSVAVSYLCDQKFALQGLLHDGSEAYIADIATPIKRLPELEQYKKIEKNIQFHIYKKFGIHSLEHPSVKEADILMLATEAKSLLLNIDPDWELLRTPLPFEIKKLAPEEAEELFLKRFYEIFSI